MKIDAAFASMFDLHMIFHQIFTCLFKLVKTMSKSARNCTKIHLQTQKGLEFQYDVTSLGNTSINQLNSVSRKSSQNVRSLSENGVFSKNAHETFRSYDFISHIYTKPVLWQMQKCFLFILIPLLAVLTNKHNRNDQLTVGWYQHQSDRETRDLTLRCYCYQ